MSLGCGSHTARIVDRDGGVVAEADTLTRVEWGRVLDDTSSARATVSPEGLDCCGRLGQARAWRHRIDIWRENTPVWSGPIITIRWSVGEVEIVAADITAWLARRVPHRDIQFDDADLTTIGQWLIADGFRPDDPGHEVQVLEPARISGNREYETDVGQTLDHIDDLAETGLDYTTVGHRILLMSEDHCQRVGSLSDNDFPEGLTVVEDGSTLATRWVIWGDTDDDGNTVKGEAGGSHPYYHLLEQVDEESSILDDGSAAAAARSRLRGSSPTPVFIDSQTATLSPDAPVEVASLVPGYCLDVTSDATCRRIQQTMKLFALRVTENADGETVAVTLSPAGV